MPNICLVDFNFQRSVRRLHQLGPRAVAELLLEIAGNPRVNVMDRLTAYAGLDYAQLRAAGGDRFPSQPLSLVPRRIKSRVRAGAAVQGEIVRDALGGGDAA